MSETGLTKSDIEKAAAQLAPYALDPNASYSPNELLAPQPRTFFCNLEEALAIDKNRSQRREARAFMPVRDQVLVFPCDKEEFSDSGLIVLPATAQEKQSEGIVIAAGRGRIDANNVFIPTEVQPGDRVLFGKYAGQEVTLRGKVCRLMLEPEILGVIR